MAQTLSEALHAKLDQLGAPPREQVAPLTVNDLPEGQDVTGVVDIYPDSSAGETQSAGPMQRVPAAEDQAEPMYAPGETDDGAELDGNAEAGQDDQQQAPGETPERMKAAEFAQAIGWEPQDLYTTLEIPIGPNGETRTLGEIKDQYGALQAQLAEAEQAQAALQAERQQFQEHAQQQMQGGSELSQELQQAIGTVAAIEQQYAQVPWDKIEAEDAGKAANLRQKFATGYAQAQEQLKQAKAKEEQQRQQFQQQFLTQQQQRVMELVPEWKDPGVFEKENPEISTYMLSRGFTQEELPTIFHAGLRALARDAWLWHKHQGEVAKAKGKLTRPPPKQVLRPGGPRKEPLANRERDAAMKRARETGRQDHKLAAARAIVQSAMRKR